MLHTIVSSLDAKDRLDPEFHIANNAIKERVIARSESLDVHEANIISHKIAGMMTQGELGAVLDPLRRSNRRRGMEEAELDRVLREYPFQTLVLLEDQAPKLRAQFNQKIHDSHDAIAVLNAIDTQLNGNQPTLFIVRGHPGSGKSTYARHLIEQNPGAIHIENDTFFTDANGKYAFEIEKHEEAKQWCLDQVRESLEKGRNTVVSNTFTILKELQPYLDLGYRTQVVEMELNYTDTHQVPKDVIEAKKQAFESFEGATRVSSCDYAQPTRQAPRPR
jgi:predicted kinase